MMKYEEFESALLEKVRFDMGPSYKVEVQKITKNNGLILNGISIIRQGERVSPIIYLDPYFEKYCEGMEMEEISREVFRAYEDSKDQGKDFSEYVFDFEQLKNRVIFKLICKKTNEELLSDVPYTPYLDLAIVYYVLWDTNDAGQTVMLIRNAHLKKWGLLKEDLHHLAEINTERLCPANINSLHDVIYDMVKTGVGEDEAKEFCDTDELDKELFPMFVLTNEKSLNGACCILYENLLGKFAEEENTDIIILPSSIHETLLIPLQSGIEPEYFAQIVKDVNATLEKEEILSNSVYIYKREGRRVQLAS